MNPSSPNQELFDAALKYATAGASLIEIRNELSKTCDTDTLAVVFDAVLEYYRTLSEFNAEAELGKAYARLNMIFHNSLKIQDYKTALATQKEINRLLKLGLAPSDAKAIDIESLLQ